MERAGVRNAGTVGCGERLGYGDSFGSLTEAFDQHGKLLSTAAVYKPAMAQAQDPDAFADALTGVYATDPQYGYMLKWVIHNYGFIRFDH
jgi:flagellum-specific peptidoglycan hydrolase FlgJ